MPPEPKEPSNTPVEAFDFVTIALTSVPPTPSMVPDPLPGWLQPTP